MQDCSEGDPSAALQIMGPQALRTSQFSLKSQQLVKKCCISSTKDSVTVRVSCYRPVMHHVHVLQLHVILVVNNCCVSL